MSNRKLVGALSILFLAILFMSIGCGDGKRNTHQNTRKVNPGGKVTPAGGQKPGTTGSQKSQAEQRLRDARLAAEAGTPLMRENIPAGTYALDEVMGFVEYQLGNEVLVSFANATVLENNDMTVKLNDKSGVAMTKDMDNGRTVEIAKSFAATGASSLTPTGQNLVFKAQTSSTDGTMNISLNPPGSAEVSLLSAVMSATRNSDGSYGSKIGAKDLNIRILQSGNSIRFALHVQEKAMSTVGNKNTSFTRNMTITYKTQQAPPGAGAGISN